jgi:hypothetical protein
MRKIYLFQKGQAVPAQLTLSILFIEKVATLSQQLYLNYYKFIIKYFNSDRIFNAKYQLN